MKTLLKVRTRREEISEKIRLLYVAVTRAKEKMIFVVPKLEESMEVMDILPLYEREEYVSFLSIFKSIYSLLLPYIQETDVVGNHDYFILEKNESNLLEKEEDTLVVSEMSFSEQEIVNKHFSKDSFHLITKEEKDLMDFGTQIHAILEEIDLFDYHLEDYHLSPFIEKKLLSFLQSSFLKQYQNCSFYREYEFLMEENNSLSHGIIDLLIETDDSYVIVDYKLKNIMDENYDKQLNGYRHYIESKTGKKVSCYLYSLLEEAYREVLCD